jgi:hypothetical protein
LDQPLRGTADRSGSWLRRTGAMEASTTGRDRSDAEGERRELGHIRATGEW